MSVLLKGERFNHNLTGSSSDTVLTGFDLPAGSVLKHIGARIHVISNLAAVEREQSAMYAIAAYLIELDDPDAVVSYEDLWDRFVPKYTDVDLIDLDTAGADVTPFWEPGEARFDEIFDMGDRPLRLFMRRKMVTFADPGSAGFRFQPAETPFEPQYMPADIINFKLNRSIRVRKPSCVVVAMSNPALDDTVSNHPALTESEWGQIQYIESTLERALMDQLGQTEAGAESPWEEASDIIRKHLAPDIQEETAGAFITLAWNAFVTLQFSHTVPGSMDFRTIDLTP